MINKNSIAFAIVLTAFLAFPSICDAQSLKERIKQRANSVKESVKSDWSIGQTEANSNQTNQTKTAETAPFQKVDLGLNVLWASSNIDAYSPEQFGTYYAWGALLPPGYGESFGEWRSYKWNDPNGEFKKYDESDKKTRLELVDDVAHNRYGGGWRVPTNDEFRELMNKCSWSWQQQNDVWGYKVTGPNGNSIFLPAGGYNPSNHIIQKNEYGSYWSSEIGSERRLGMTEAKIDYRRGCFLAFFRGGSVSLSSGDRNNGLLIRAVWDDSLVSGDSAAK